MSRLNRSPTIPTAPLRPFHMFVCQRTTAFITTFFTTFIALTLTLLPTSASAWGREGHQIIARIAQANLTPEAEKAIRSLLANRPMAEVAAWADQIHSSPSYQHTKPWHYLNPPIQPNQIPATSTTPSNASATDPAPRSNLLGDLIQAPSTAKLKQILPRQITFDDSPPEGSALWAVCYFSKQLNAPQLTQAQRSEALRFLIHFVGDLHQPMHVSLAEDRGGNDIPLIFNDESTNLHSLWDSGLLAPLLQDVEDQQTQQEGSAFLVKPSWQLLADHLKQAAENTPSMIALAGESDPNQWATESYFLTLTMAYDILPNGQINQDYTTRGQRLVGGRLALAGIRLGQLLNALFDPQSPEARLHYAQAALAAPAQNIPSTSTP